jgi:hypothetical protein
MLTLVVNAAPEQRTVQVYTNGVLAPNSTNLFAANSNAVNAVIAHPETAVDITSISNSVHSLSNAVHSMSNVVENLTETTLSISNSVTVMSNTVSSVSNTVANLQQNTFVLDVLRIHPASGGTNFWLDCGRTNASGSRYIYHTILATNDVSFIGPTNCVSGSILSVNVVSTGGDRLISFPPLLPHLDTNGLTFEGGRYHLTLANGNEFRMTIQSNITMSTLWYTPEQ